MLDYILALIYWALPAPNQGSKHWRDRPPHKDPSITRGLDNGDSYEEVWEVFSIGGDQYRVRYVYETPTHTLRVGGAVYDWSQMPGSVTEGYRIECATPTGWDSRGTFGFDLIEEEKERIQQEVQERNCFIHDWQETSAGVGGEMIPARHCSKCGKLKLDW